jgi:hypothetical protein
MPPQEEASLPPWEEPVTHEADGGIVTCEHCGRHFTLIHLRDGTHQVKPYAPH